MNLIQIGTSVHSVNKILQFFVANILVLSVAKLYATHAQSKAYHFWREMDLSKNELAMIASIKFQRLPFNFSAFFLLHIESYFLRRV